MYEHCKYHSGCIGPISAWKLIVTNKLTILILVIGLVTKDKCVAMQGTACGKIQVLHRGPSDLLLAVSLEG